MSLKIPDRVLREADLIALFDHPLTRSQPETRMLVHAFQHFWAEDDDAAVHLVLPRVEDLLRWIGRNRGVGIVNVAKGTTPGGLSQLGALISAMPEAGFDEDYTRYFSLLPTDGVHGLNLRNNVGHGLCDCPPRHHIALALHTAVTFSPLPTARWSSQRRPPRSCPSRIADAKGASRYGL